MFEKTFLNDLTHFSSLLTSFLNFFFKHTHHFYCFKYAQGFEPFTACMLSREHAQSKPNSNGPLITAHVKLARENKSVAGNVRLCFSIKAQCGASYLGNQMMKTAPNSMLGTQ